MGIIIGVNCASITSIYSMGVSTRPTAEGLNKAMFYLKVYTTILAIGILISISGFKCSGDRDMINGQVLQMKLSPSPPSESISPNDTTTLNGLIESGNRNIVITKPTLLTEDLTIPYGYSIDIKNGGMITCENPFTIQLYGDFDAGNVKVFDDSLNVVFGAGSVEKVNVNWFGAFADTQLAIDVEGEDDTRQIQRAINSAEFVKNVFFPAYRPADFKWYGAYRISKTIQVRIPGKNFRGISLFGEESYDSPKSVIYADFLSGGAINVQSARGSVIAYLAIAGKNIAPENNKKLYSAAITDYQSEGVNSSAKTAYSGISIDANEGEPGSANTIIKYCRISKFYVGINVNAAGETQGDMLSVEHNAFRYNAIHIAIGNSQARSIAITRCDFDRGHTVIDNLTFGLGSTVNFSRNQITHCYQLLNYTTAAGGPSEMSGNYAEMVGRIGKVLGGRNQNTLTMRDGTLKFVPKTYKVNTFFEGQSNLLISSCLIQVNRNQELVFKNSKNTKFENTRFRCKKGKPTITGDNLSFENCTIASSSQEVMINTMEKSAK